MVVAGQTGCGKTHVARRIHEFVGLRLVDAYHSGWLPDTKLDSPAFLRWDRVAEMDDDDWDATVDRWVMPTHLVVVDDVGAETDRYKSGVPKSRLKQLLDICEHKWMFLTTNIGREEWEPTFGQRTADRLKEAKYLSMFDVPSYRGHARP